MQIINERVRSAWENVTIHDFCLGYRMKEEYRVRVEIVVEDDGHTVYIEGLFDSLRYYIMWTVVSESTYTLLGDGERDILNDDNVPIELAKRHDNIMAKGVSVAFPGIDAEKRYEQIKKRLVELVANQTALDGKEYPVTDLETEFGEWRFSWDEDD